MGELDLNQDGDKDGDEESLFMDFEVSRITEHEVKISFEK